MKRSRVLHLVVAGDIGGAERLLVDLATRAEVTDADHEVALITPNRALFTYFVEAGLTVHDRGPAREDPLSYLVRSLGNADVAWVTALVQAQRIDVLHTHTFGTHVLGTRAARRAKVKQLRTEHHVMHYADHSTSAFTRWAAARTDRLVAVSEYVRNTILSTMPALTPRMSVVRNGIDVAHWQPQPRNESEPPFRAAVVCRLTGWKRVHLAIEAAARAEVELWIIGDGEERKNLETVAQRAEARVKFCGFQKDPRALLAECDVLLSTAKEEPLGLSVLESLAMGKPIVACATGGIPEIVQNEITGFLAENDSVTAIAHVLERAREKRDQLPGMGAAGRAFVERECTITRMCEGYAAVYHSLREAT